MAVLIVEDDPLIRLGLVDAFRDQNFDALEAVHADEAITILESRNDITLVVTDIDMPKGSINGLGLAAHVRLKWPPVHIFITSGHRRPSQGEFPSNSRYFPKPFSFDYVVSEAARLTH